MSLLLLFNSVAVTSGAIASTDAGFSDAIGAVRIVGTIASDGADYSDAVGTVHTPVVPTIPQGKGGWYDPWTDVVQVRITGRVSSAAASESQAVGRLRIGGTVRSVGVAESSSRGGIRLRGRVTSGSMASTDGVMRVSDDNIVFAWNDFMDGEMDEEDLVLMEMV